MFERIKARYEKHYVTDTQLGRYVALGVITEAQAEAIRAGNELTEIPSGGGYRNDLTIRLPGALDLVLRPREVQA